MIGFSSNCFGCCKYTSISCSHLWGLNHSWIWGHYHIVVRIAPPPSAPQVQTTRVIIGLCLVTRSKIVWKIMIFREKMEIFNRCDKMLNLFLFSFSMNKLIFFGWWVKKNFKKKRRREGWGTSYFYEMKSTSPHHIAQFNF